MGSRPRKIGMGVPNILGFVERGCRKMGVPIFLVTQALILEVCTILVYIMQTNFN